MLARVGAAETHTPRWWWGHMGHPAAAVLGSLSTNPSHLTRRYHPKRNKNTLAKRRVQERS